MIIVMLIPFNHCEIILQSKFKFDTLFKAAFIRQGFFFATILILYFSNHGNFTVTKVLLLQLVALITGNIYILWKSKTELLTEFVHDPELTKKLFHFGKFTFSTIYFRACRAALIILLLPII